MTFRIGAGKPTAPPWVHTVNQCRVSRQNSARFIRFIHRNNLPQVTWNGIPTARGALFAPCVNTTSGVCCPSACDAGILTRSRKRITAPVGRMTGLAYRVAGNTVVRSLVTRLQCRMHQLTDRFIVKSDLPTTWDFFSNAENLPRITPAWMGFEIRTPRPIEIQQDSIIDYTIRWLGLPIRWRTRIIDWTPQRQFIDLQIRGPYTLWHHQHTFTPTDEGTLCTDRVLYKIPGGPIGTVMNALMVKRQLIEIFNFRRKAMSQSLGFVRAVQEHIEIHRL